MVISSSQAITYPLASITAFANDVSRCSQVDFLLFLKGDPQAIEVLGLHYKSFSTQWLPEISYVIQVWRKFMPLYLTYPSLQQTFPNDATSPSCVLLGVYNSVSIHHFCPVWINFHDWMAPRPTGSSSSVNAPVDDDCVVAWTGTPARYIAHKPLWCKSLRLVWHDTWVPRCTFFIWSKCE